MVRTHELLFGSFRLDCDNQQLWRGEQQLALQPKPLAVLQYLAQHAGRLIPKEEFLQQVWAGTHVAPKTLTVCIHAIRAILGDTEAPLQFLATQGKQGYRWIADTSEGRRAASPLSPHISSPNVQASSFVGREKDLAQLQEWYAAASAGTCQLVFISGEAGIGKTTLVNRFLASLRAMGQAWISAGQGVQHHGVGEAYLPVMTVLSRFARGAEHAEMRAVLQHYAPNWLVRVPALWQDGENKPPADPLPLVTPQRLMWELGEVFRVLTERRPIVLVFDDLQWSDSATIDWLAYLARWQEPLRLLILGTYRPADVIASRHPLRAITQELRGKGQSTELRLELLNRQQVQDYCTQQFPGSALPARLITLIHRRTDGNPLFLVRLTEYLVQQRFLTQTEGRWQLAKPVAEVDLEIPHELQGMIEQQVEQLSVEEQRILDVASVVGEAFASEVVAAGVRLPTEQVEAICDELVRKKQVIEGRETQEWPDGTITACYGFQHALFRDVVYRRLGEGRRIRLHRQIAERVESLQGEQGREIAGELAGHYAHGHKPDKAVQYYHLAAERAVQRSAYQEALGHCQAGLALLPKLRQAQERLRQELELRLSLSVILTETEGFTGDELAANLQRAGELCQAVNDRPRRVAVLVGLTRLHALRADRAKTEELAESERCLLEQVQDPVLALRLHAQLVTTETMRGAHDRVQRHAAQVLALHTPADYQPLLSVDPILNTLGISGWSAWLAGQPADAVRRVEQSLVCARETGDPFPLTLTLWYATHVRQCRGELAAARALAQQLVTLTHEYGFSLYDVLGSVTLACIAVQAGKVEKETITLINNGLAQMRAKRLGVYTPFFLSFLAQGYAQLGRMEDALATIAEAIHLSETTLAAFWQAEAYRVKGELLLVHEGKKQKGKSKRQKAKMADPRPLIPDLQGEAEAYFLKAIEIARRQEAKSLELRAAMSLARLWQTQDKKKQAHQMLAEIYHWFTEGFDTKDLQEAKALLAELAVERP